MKTCLSTATSQNISIMSPHIYLALIEDDDRPKSSQLGEGAVKSINLSSGNAREDAKLMFQWITAVCSESVVKIIFSPKMVLTVPRVFTKSFSENLFGLHFMSTSINKIPLTLAVVHRAQVLCCAHMLDMIFYFIFFFYFKYIYTGWTIQLHCSSVVPCYKVEYINIRNTYIHIHKYKSYIKASISW